MTRPYASNRRSFLGGTLAAASLTALGGLLAACGDDGDSTAASGGTSGGASSGAGDAGSAPAGPWSWTDELGQTVQLDQAPTRIVAYADQAAALIGFGVRPVGLFAYTGPGKDPAFDGVDLSGIEVIGTQYGEINLEKLAALQPDLVMTTYYNTDTTDDLYGFKDKAQIDKVRQIAPITGVMQDGSALDVIQMNEKFVVSLGVDVTTGAVAEAKRAFQDASAALTKAAASGLTVLPVYAEDADLYVAKAPDDPALRYYQQLGLQFVDVTGKDYYWEILSWENSDKYSPDIVLYATRDSYTPDQLQDQAVFASLPAMQAGQLHPWEFKSMDYAAQAPYLQQLADWASSDRKVT